MNVQLRKLEPTKIEEFRELLGSTDFGGCFCAVWTNFDSDWDNRCGDASQPNFFSTKADLEKGRHVGYLAYHNEELVGWTGSGPKTSFPLMKTKLGSRVSEFSKDVWSIGCLAVSAKFRGQNLAEKIVNAVIEEARGAGAKTIEAYPVRPFHEPRMYRGSFKLFQKLGFVETASEKDGDFEILLLQRPLVVEVKSFK